MLLVFLRAGSLDVRGFPLLPGVGHVLPDVGLRLVVASVLALGARLLILGGRCCRRLLGLALALLLGPSEKLRASEAGVVAVFLLEFAAGFLLELTSLRQDVILCTSGACAHKR